MYYNQGYCAKTNLTKDKVSKLNQLVKILELPFNLLKFRTLYNQINCLSST